MEIGHAFFMGPTLTHQGSAMRSSDEKKPANPASGFTGLF
jgi:hypothetical protein